MMLALEVVTLPVTDPVIVGPLVRGKDFEPNNRPYNTGMSGSELRALFGQLV
jgi:hypothetical protein